MQAELLQPIGQNLERTGEPAKNNLGLFGNDPQLPDSELHDARRVLPATQKIRAEYRLQLANWLPNNKFRAKERSRPADNRRYLQPVLGVRQSDFLHLRLVTTATLANHNY